MFCVERRKSWRMLQSKAGVINKEYIAQKALLAEVDAGKIDKAEFFAHAHEMLTEKLGTATPALAKA
jgi:pyruvate-ferredoxin/flavodoxin oxidoreductase